MKHCLTCKATLTGKQTKFCGTKCSSKHHNNSEAYIEYRKQFVNDGRLKIARAKYDKAIPPEKILLKNAKHRSKRDKLDFNIDIRDIIIPTHCPLLGIALERGSNGEHLASSPTLDKIDPTKGYIKGNVWVISYRANVAKHNLTLMELQLLVRNLEHKVIDATTFQG